MSWMQRLYDTYEANRHRIGRQGDDPPLTPILHIVQPAHVQVALNTTGKFLGATVIQKSESAIIIPCTEESMGRSGTKPAGHALSDTLQYLAGDYASRYRGRVTVGFVKQPRQPYEDYLSGLTAWCDSEYRNDRVASVLAYVAKGTLATDLLKENIICTDTDYALIEEWPARDKPELFRVCKYLSKALICWNVKTPGDPSLGLHEDPAIWDSWMNYQLAVIAKKQKKVVCAVSGAACITTTKHPKKIIATSPNAKLISADDKAGFTYRGRFETSAQACSIGLAMSYQAHSALSWLIGRQAYQHETQAILSWAVSGKAIPDVIASSDNLFADATAGEVADGDEDSTGVVRDTSDVGQAFSRRLAKLIAGYKATLGPADDIITMGLDSATPGRMAVTFYRELKGSEFLERINRWHEDFAWPQRFSWDVKFIGAPSPKDIAQAAFPRPADRKTSERDKKLWRATVERLLPCIIDGRPIPTDLVDTVVRRCQRRASMSSEKRRVGNKTVVFEVEWEKILGIVCSLFRGSHQERNYSMALEPDRRTRDYLYGRLFALAEHLEQRALYVAGESRDTTAARNMHRFCDRPYSTWLNIEGKGLPPYRSRLQSKRPGFLYRINKLIDEVHALFESDDYMLDTPLTGEWLLGYHCQRRELNTSPERDGESSNDNHTGGN